jgi:hypothetical protein
MKSGQANNIQDDMHSSIYEEVERKAIMQRRFFRDLSSWAGTVIVLIAIDVFLGGGLTWSKFPVFFYSLFMMTRFIKYIRAQRFGGEYPGRSGRRNRKRFIAGYQEEQEVEDYSDTLLHRKERELADLKEYRQPGKLWKDEDLV